jgi:hypothetical protein
MEFFQGFLVGIGIAGFYWGWQFRCLSKKVTRQTEKWRDSEISIKDNFEKLRWVNEQLRKQLTIRRNRF